jgi:hypothetical protein
MNPCGAILALMLIGTLSCSSHRPDNPISLDTVLATRVDGCRHWSYVYGYSVHEKLDSLVYHDTYNTRSPDPKRFLPEGYIYLDMVKVYDDDNRCLLGYEYSNWRKQ